MEKAKICQVNVIYQIIVFIFFFQSCSSDDKFEKLKEIKAKKANHWVRFEEKIQAISSASDKKLALNKIESDYPEFTNIYFLNLLNDTFHPDTTIVDVYHKLIRSKLSKELNDTIAIVFKNIKKEEIEYANAFERLRYLGLNIVTPQIFTCVSELGAATFMVSDSLMGISLDLFLGARYKYYDYQIWPGFIQRSMNRQNLVPNLVKTYIRFQLLQDRPNTAFVSNLIDQGKEMYLLKRVLPFTADSILFGYTQNQLDWCLANEKEIWAYFIDKKLVYSQNTKLFEKYTSESPHSIGMPDDAPGRITAFIGWKIIEQYMQRKDNVSVSDLLSNQNYQSIFEASKYKPK